MRGGTLSFQKRKRAVLFERRVLLNGVQRQVKGERGFHVVQAQGNARSSIVSPASYRELEKRDAGGKESQAFIIISPKQARTSEGKGSRTVVQVKVRGRRKGVVGGSYLEKNLPK